MVILQFEKASKIQSVDIGNESSAFVELFVGRSSDTSDSAYRLLLASSSFMSPIESRNGSNVNRVRIFNRDQFVKDVLDEKWDRLKVVLYFRVFLVIFISYSVFRVVSYDIVSDFTEMRMIFRLFVVSRSTEVYSMG